MSAVSPFAHEESEAYQAAFALHLHLCKIPRVRGGGRYQQKVESASFRIVMLLCEAAARGQDSRASDLSASAREMCLKVSTTLAVMRASGFIEAPEFDRLTRQTRAVEAVLVLHLRGRGAIAVPSSVAQPDGSEPIAVESRSDPGGAVRASPLDSPAIPNGRPPAQAHTSGTSQLRHRKAS